MTAVKLTAVILSIRTEDTLNGDTRQVERFNVAPFPSHYIGSLDSFLSAINVVLR